MCAQWGVTLTDMLFQKFQVKEFISWFSVLYRGWMILHLLLHESDKLRLLGVSEHFLLDLMSFLQSGFVLLWFGTENKADTSVINTTKDYFQSTVVIKCCSLNNLQYGKMWVPLFTSFPRIPCNKLCRGISLIKYHRGFRGKNSLLCQTSQMLQFLLFSVMNCFSLIFESEIFAWTKRNLFFSISL